MRRQRWNHQSHNKRMQQISDKGILLLTSPFRLFFFFSFLKNPVVFLFDRIHLKDFILYFRCMKKFTDLSFFFKNDRKHCLDRFCVLGIQCSYILTWRKKERRMITDKKEVRQCMLFLFKLIKLQQNQVMLIQPIEMFVYLFAWDFWHINLCRLFNA